MAETKPDKDVTPSKKRPRHWVKWVVRTIVAVVVLVLLAAIIAAAALAMNIPQRAAINYVAGTQFDAEVEIGDLSTFGGVTLSDLEVYERANGGRKAEPMVALEGLKADYSLFPEDKRYISSLSIDSLQLNLDSSQPAKPAGPAAQPAAKPAPQKAEKPAKKMKMKKKKSDSTPVIPKAVHIGRLDLASASDAGGIELAPLSVDGDYASKKKYNVAVKGEDLAGSWWLGSPESKRDIAGGTVNIDFAKDGKSTQVNALRIDLPGTADITATGHLKEGDTTELDLNVEKMAVNGMDISAPGGPLPFPLSFDSFDMTGTQIKGQAVIKRMKVSFAGTKLNVAAKNLMVGPKESPYYSGDLTLRGGQTEGEELNLGLETVLSNGKTLKTKLTGSPVQLQANITSEPWAKDELAAFLPKGARGVLGALPTLKTVAMNADVGWKLPNLEFKTALDAELAGETAALTLGGKGSALLLFLSKTAQFEVAGGLKLAGGNIDVTGNVSNASASHLDFAVDKLDPRRWLKAFIGDDVMPGLTTAIGGTVGLDIEKDMTKIATAFDLKAETIELPGVALPEGGLALAGSVTYDKTGEAPKVSGESLAFQLGADTALRLTNWSVPMDSYNVQAQVEADVDLATVTGLAGVSDVRGHVNLKAPVTNESGYMKAPLTVTLENLGVGGLSMPYGTPLVAESGFEYDNINDKGSGKDLKATLGEGTTLTAASWTMTALPFSFDLPCSLETDLQPLTAMGWLDSVTGSCTAKGSFRVAGGVASNFEVDAKAESLAVAGGWASLAGATLSGTLGNSASGLDGALLLTADKLNLPGVALEAVKGPITLEGDTLKAAGVEGALCGGSVKADAEVGVLQDGMPLQTALHLENVDLGMLSEQLAIPSVKLGGKASGDIVVAGSPAGLTEFKVDLAAPDGFAIGLGVIDALLTKQLEQQIGNAKKIERVKSQLIGKEDPRPFDSASLTMALEGERIMGQLTLKSATMDLTIDLPVDTAAVLYGLTLLQGM